MTTYEKLRKLARKDPPKTDGLTAEQLQAAIDGISAELRGPGVGDGMRIALNEDRHIYRAALATLRMN